MVDKVWDMVISSVCAFVCLYVRALKGKWLELSTPKFGHWGPLAAIKGFLLLRGGGIKGREGGLPPSSRA